MSTDKNYPPPQYPPQAVYGQAASYQPYGTPQPGYPPQYGAPPQQYGAPPQQYGAPPQPQYQQGYAPSPQPQVVYIQQQPQHHQNNNNDDLCMGCYLLSS
ncbi:hypothetical protein BGZ98_000489 [Dissophora globulifera]|nr:hypothetical protein BGZ98_000489 [Dissophora globulifera]